MKNAYALLTAGALGLAPSVARAEEAPGDSIVVTAARAPRALAETGVAITVIDQSEIARRQSIAVVDLLRTVPGVTYARNGGIGGVASIYIRGAEGDHTVALIDGVKLNDPSGTGGGFNFGNLLVGNIDRIEVVRGSQSVLWGSQAIGGVINLITRRPGEELAINARAEGGGRDSRELVGNVSGQFGPVAASVGGGYFRSDGFSSFSEERGGRERDGFRNYGANAAFNIALADAISVDLRGWYSDSKSDYDGLAPPTFSFGDTREYTLTKEFVGYAGLNTALLDGRWNNRLAYTRTEVKRENFDPDGFLLKTFDARGTNERFEYQGVFAFGGGLSADFGAEKEKSRFRNSSFGSPFQTARADMGSFYGQLTAKPLQGLTLTAGARHDDHDRFGGETSFAANGAFTPNAGDTVLRASYGEGFKAPSLYQLLGDYGNVVLQPETSRSWDVGVTQHLADSRIELSATWFHRDTENLITFISCTGRPAGICTGRPFGTYDNTARARAKGIETSVAFRPTDALTVQGGYSWIESEDRTTGLVLARRPAHTANAELDWRLPFGLELGGTVTLVGDSFDNAANTRRLEGYVVVDLRASYPVTETIELYGRVENLFDEQYETAFQYGTQRRAAFGGVRLRL